MGAFINFDYTNKELALYAKLIFYGNEATEELALKIKMEIESLYNEPKVNYTKEGLNFLVKFYIDFEIAKIPDVYDKIRNNDKIINNFIRIGLENPSSRSFMGYGLGENCGHWLVSDQLGESTTAAHEFGHCLGLDHPENYDFRNRGVPPIMAPRGSFVDAAYQWDVNAKPGEKGGTMRPIHRKVWPEEVLQIINNTSLDSGYQFIGILANRSFDEKGNQLEFV